MHSSRVVSAVNILLLTQKERYVYVLYQSFIGFR